MNTMTCSHFKMDGMQIESLLYWKQSCAQKVTNESAVRGKIGSLRHIHPAEAPAQLLWACHYFKDLDYRFICSSSSTEGHLSVTLVNVLSKQHTPPHCKSCFGVTSCAVNTFTVMAVPQLHELKKINVANTVTLSMCFGQSGALVAWRTYLVIFFYSTVLFKALEVLEKILIGIGVPRPSHVCFMLINRNSREIGSYGQRFKLLAVNLSEYFRNESYVLCGTFKCTVAFWVN